MEEEIQKLMRERADADAERELEMNRTNADQRKEELRRRENRQRTTKMKESDKPRLSKEDLPDFDENAGIGSSKKGFNMLMARGCKLRRIDVIRDNLHKKNLERFEQSCFGHLLNISDDTLKFQGQLISYLVTHMDEGACSKGRPVFTITNSKKGSRRLANFVKTEDCSEPAAAARDNLGKEPEMRGCSRASVTCSDDEVKMASGDDDHVIFICDSSEDDAPDADYCVGEGSNSIRDEQDSDDDSCSNSYMNKLVARLQSRKKRQIKHV